MLQPVVLRFPGSPENRHDFIHKTCKAIRRAHQSLLVDVGRDEAEANGDQEISSLLRL